MYIYICIYIYVCILDVQSSIVLWLGWSCEKQGVLFIAPIELLTLSHGFSHIHTYTHNTHTVYLKKISSIYGWWHYFGISAYKKNKKLQVEVRCRLVGRSPTIVLMIIQSISLGALLKWWYKAQADKNSFWTWGADFVCRRSSETNTGNTH